MEKFQSVSSISLVYTSSSCDIPGLYNVSVTLAKEKKARAYACDICAIFAKGLLELKRLFSGEPNLGGMKLSGSRAKPGRGGASVVRVSGNLGSIFV